MRTLRSAIVAAGLSLAVAQPAAAQFQTYCSPTAAGACVGIGFLGSPAGTTLLLQNLQGSIGPQGTGRFDLQYVEITLRSGLIRVTSPDLSEEEGALRPEGCLSQVVGAVVEGNDCFRPSHGDVTWIGEQTFSNLMTAHTFINFGILGCTGVTGDDFVAQTCPANGLTGAVALPLYYDLYDDDGNLLRRLRPHDFDVLIVGNDAEGGAFEHRFSAVPEPATVALLGGGLALLGGTGFVRRRRSDPLA